MYLTDAQAISLLNIDKMVIETGVLRQEVILKSNTNIEFRCHLKAITEDFRFLLNIHQGKHDHLKLSLHLQETVSSSPVGLLRIDYGNSPPHTNPLALKDSVPSFAIPYAGQEIKCNHAHFYVSGYKSLAWAVPLEAFDFSVRYISDFELFENAIAEFAEKINLKTRLLLGRMLYL